MTNRIHSNLRFRVGSESELRNRLVTSAKNNNRSLNAEILHRLTQSFIEQDSNALMEALADRTVAKIVARLKS